MAMVGADPQALRRVARDFAAAAVVKGLDDGAAMYLHYAGNTGADVNYDLGEAYREDDGMRASINWEMANTAAAADGLALDGATRHITGPAHLNLQYPTTENWQKAVVGHQQWSSAR